MRIKVDFEETETNRWEIVDAYVDYNIFKELKHASYENLFYIKGVIDD